MMRSPGSRSSIRKQKTHHYGSLLDSNDDDVKEGELTYLSEQSSKPTAHWMVLKGRKLYSYTQRENQQEPNHIFNLKLYGSASSQGCLSCFNRSTEFQLLSRTGTSTLNFKAPTIEDRKDWVQRLAKIVDGYGTTIRSDNRMETTCSVWLFLLCIAMLVLFAASATGAALSKPSSQMLLHAFCIPLSAAHLALLILCTYYARQFKWANIRKLIKLNKFWIEAVLCFLFNMIAFFSLFIHLSVQLSRSNDEHAWNFANGAVYLFAAFSIPFPAICIRLYHQYKDTARALSRSSISFTPRLSIQRESLSTTTRPLRGTEEQAGADDDSNDDDELEAKHDEMDPVEAWLKDMDLLQYHEKFNEENIRTLNQVQKLKEHHLAAMGVKIGDRVTMMEMILRMNGRGIARSFSQAATLSAAEPIFRDSISKGSICLCYVTHLVTFIGYPLMQNEYMAMLRVMYPDYNDGNTTLAILFYTNHIFLRSFVGMTLITVFFTFITELTDKVIIRTNYRVLWDLFVGNDEGKYIWLGVVLLICASIPFEIDAVRDHIHATTNKVEIIINVIWSAIEFCALLICFLLVLELSSIYTKTKDIWQRFYEHTTPSSPIHSFVLECVVLLSLFTVYIVFMALYDMDNADRSDAKIWDISRQLLILLLSIFQSLALIRAKQIQKFSLYYLPRFEKRKAYILHICYQFNCMLLVYNIIYVFMFQIQYFGHVLSRQSGAEIDPDQKTAYAFSFALPASLLFILSHFLASYEKWQSDKTSEKNRSIADEGIPGLSGEARRNSALNKHIKEQEASQHHRTSSLLSNAGNPAMIMNQMIEEQQ